MKIKTGWALESLALCLLFNLSFAAVIFYMSHRLIDGCRQWMAALGATFKPSMPAEVHRAFDGLSALITQASGRLLPVLAVLVFAFTLLLWFFIFLTGCGKLRRTAAESEKSRLESPPAETGPEEVPCESENV
ncbi:MAG: hypothetical protein ACP5IL_14625 [Syntrophobacteraceae bacterium]